MKNPPLKPGDVYPAHVLRDEYGMSFDKRPTIVINEEEVPEAFRILIPYAERWAIACDVTRHDYFAHQTQKDIAVFWRDLLPHVEQINQWLDSLPSDVAAWPTAAVHFMYLLKSHEEAYQPTDVEREAARKRQEAWARERRRNEAVETAMKAFHVKNYFETVELLEPFESEVGEVVRAKLQFARKKIGKGNG